jgi:LysR family transcriptional activator of nhaA
VPVADSPVRSAFDSFCTQNQFKPRIVAEADDMAMLRLLARDTGALAINTAKPTQFDSRLISNFQK